MKKWNWRQPARKSCVRLSNLSGRSLVTRCFTLLLVLALQHLATSCKTPASSTQSANQLSDTKSLTDGDRHYSFSTCISAGASELKAAVFIFGERTTFHFSFSDENLISAKVEGIKNASFSFASSEDISHKLMRMKAHLCNGLKAEAASLLSELSTQLLISSIDSCTLENSDNRFECKFPSTTPAEATDALATMKKSMIRTWTKQPYVFARRLAVAAELASMLQNVADFERKSAAFCSMIRYSLPAEMPLVLRSATTRMYLCETRSETTKIDAAKFVLRSCLDELDLIKKAGERRTTSGLFSVKIPVAELPESAQQIYRGEFLVTVRPDAPAKNSTLELSESPSQRSHQRCWHPLLSADQNLFDIAQGVGLIVANPLGACLAEAEQKTQAQLTQYWDESLSSETQFTIRNGGVRRLKLMPGSYHYTLSVIASKSPEGGSSYDPQLPQMSGIFQWEEKRPAFSAENWQSSEKTGP